MSKQFEIIDLSYLNSIADGNQDIVNELVEIFIEQLPEFTDGLNEAFVAEKWTEVAALAHKAKSSMISMGMNEIGNVDLKNLELIAKHRRIQEIGKLTEFTDKIEKELDTLTKSLHSYPEDRQKWVVENDNNDTIKRIIDKFVSACDKAKLELNEILGAK
jgi:HPt (histidine-containing phosphotransfer) domain-containing protein